MRPLRVELWSYNYAPEPTGIGPVSEVWARALLDRGHSVRVVAAHPHYPEPRWGTRIRPYRELRDGIPVLRLPIWIGRDSAHARIRQELSFAAAQTAALGAVSTPDVVVAVSPCFPALAPTLLNARLRKVPWVLWLQDILPDGAVTTGFVRGGPILRAARALERAAYRSAAAVVVISDTFRANLLAKGVPASKVRRIYNPATRAPDASASAPSANAPTILAMGNIGHSQGLERVVDAFEASPELAALDARLRIAGTGVAADAVAEHAAAGARTEMLGLVSDDALERELATATLGLVSQRPDVAEFNVPSKLMNFMSRGIPVLAVVRPGSEVEALIDRADAGWTVSADDPTAVGTVAAQALADREARAARGANGAEFAREHFDPRATAAAFESVLHEAVQPAGPGR